MLIAYPTVTSKGHWHLPDRGMEPPTVFKAPPKAVWSKRYFRGVKTIDSDEAMMRSFETSDRLRSSILTVPMGTNIATGMNYTNIGNPGAPRTSSSGKSTVPLFSAGNPHKAFQNDFFRPKVEAPITLDRALNHVPRRDIPVTTNLVYSLGAYPTADPTSVARIRESEVTSSLLPTMVHALSKPLDSLIAYRSKDDDLTSATTVPVSFSHDISLLNQLESIPDGRLIKESTPISYTTTPYTKEAVTVDILDMGTSETFRERKDAGIQKFLRTSFETRIYNPRTETFVPVKLNKSDRENIAGTVNLSGPLKFSMPDGKVFKMKEYIWKIYQPRVGKPILILETQDPGVTKLKDPVLVTAYSGASYGKGERVEMEPDFHSKDLPEFSATSGLRPTAVYMTGGGITPAYKERDPLYTMAISGTRGEEKYHVTDVTPEYRAKATFDAAMYTKPTPIPRYTMEPTPSYKPSLVPTNLGMRADYSQPRLEEHGMSMSIKRKPGVEFSDEVYIDSGKFDEEDDM